MHAYTCQFGTCEREGNFKVATTTSGAEGKLEQRMCLVHAQDVSAAASIDLRATVEMEDMGEELADEHTERPQPPKVDDSEVVSYTRMERE